MKNKSPIILLLFSCLLPFPVFSMMADSTELLIRAQDDETLGGLKIKLRLRKKIEDGPRGNNIEIVAKDDAKAILDNDGNFLKYKVNTRGKIVPKIFLQKNGLKSRRNAWPPTQADVIRLREQNLKF